MRKLTILALIAIAALTAVLTLGGIATAEPKTTITLGDNFYSPTSKTVEKGTTVRFKWTGNHRHSVTKASGPGGDFSSKKTRSDGVNFVKTFNKSGTYRMFCKVHPTEMRLKITVP
jgi:plastocyanin